VQSTVICARSRERGKLAFGATSVLLLAIVNASGYLKRIR